MWCLRVCNVGFLYVLLSLPIQAQTIRYLYPWSETTIKTTYIQAHYSSDSLQTIYFSYVCLVQRFLLFLLATSSPEHMVLDMIVQVPFLVCATDSHLVAFDVFLYFSPFKIFSFYFVHFTWQNNRKTPLRSNNNNISHSTQRFFVNFPFVVSRFFFVCVCSFCRLFACLPLQNQILM